MNENSPKPVRSIREEAEAELREERRTEAKRRVKAKMKQLLDARQIVTNLEREMADLEAEIANGL